MDALLHETSSHQNSFHRRQFYQKVTMRTVISDKSMINNLLAHEAALKNGKNVDLHLKNLSIELGALETISPLLVTEIIVKLFAYFESASEEGKQSILNAISAVIKTNYRNIIAAKYVEDVLAIFEAFSNADDMKTVLEIIKAMMEIDEDVTENILKLGAIDIILKASEVEDEEVLQKCSIVILFIVLFGNRNSISVLLKHKINNRMVKFMHIYQDKTINYFAYFALIYLKTIHKTHNDFFESGLMDNIIHWLSENDMYLRDKVVIDCNDKSKLAQRLISLVTSKSKIAQSIGTFHICCEITKSMSIQKFFNDPNHIKVLKRIAVYSNEFSSTLATNALIVLTNASDPRMKRFMPKKLNEWSRDDIQRWLRLFGFEDYTTFFEDVNGEIFSRLKDKDLVTTYFMLDSNDRKSFLEEKSFVCEDFSQKMIEYVRKDNSNLAIENGDRKQITNEEIAAVIESPFQTCRKKFDVFISYRRRGGSDLASLVSYHLLLKGYKVFLDVKSLGSGRFADELKQSIQKSANFLLLLTTDALERCVEENDWIRIEIEMAMKSGCNIIPITRDFDNSVFESVTALPEVIRNLKEYNQIDWHHDTQDACLKKIEEYLNPRDEACIELPKFRVPKIKKFRRNRF